MLLIAQHKYGVRVCNDPKWTSFLTYLGEAAVTFELLEVKPSSPVKVNINCPTGCSKGAAFVLYNCARLETILRTYSDKVFEGVYPPLPPLEEIDFTLLKHEGAPRLARRALHERGRQIAKRCARSRVAEPPSVFLTSINAVVNFGPRSDSFIYSLSNKVAACSWIPVWTQKRNTDTRRVYPSTRSPAPEGEGPRLRNLKAAVIGAFDRRSARYGRGCGRINSDRVDGRSAGVRRASGARSRGGNGPSTEHVPCRVMLTLNHRFRPIPTKFLI
ncbi:DALR anticodon-binding domain-containing protein 3 [Eumeta japonica]|uniref:DALR anticodon-binding domain-containing protein 3 n=1 Tax=Eumeta variegata TaxID=151549 RepID=A0A4C1YVP0_EUMVA|nr:DALR anticodon-binding domain-containing protein 3 [Eumeta japonica]